MPNTITQTFIPGPRLIDGSDLNTLVSQVNSALTDVGLQQQVVNTAITDNAGVTLTGAQIASGLITRSGPSAAFTDTTPTAAQIVAALPGSVSGQAFYLTIVNTTAFAQTISAGSNVTVSGIAVVPPNASVRFLVRLTSLSAVAITGVQMGSNVTLPPAKFSTAALESATMTGAQVAGANNVNFLNTGTTPANLQFPTAADVVAAIPNAAIGFSYMLNIRNGSGSANTATITTNTGITLTGTMTIAQNVTRTFVVTLTSLTAVTVQSMGISAAGA